QGGDDLVVGDAERCRDDVETFPDQSARTTRPATESAMTTVRTAGRARCHDGGNHLVGLVLSDGAVVDERLQYFAQSSRWIGVHRVRCGGCIRSSGVRGGGTRRIG